ncbi:MAG: hypothetical protein AB3N10_20320, partial [Allomuricauda sp.]
MSIAAIISSFTYDPVTGSLSNINGNPLKTKSGAKVKLLARDGNWYNQEAVIYGLLCNRPLRKGVSLVSSDGSYQLSSLYLHDARKNPHAVIIDHLPQQ